MAQINVNNLTFCYKGSFDNIFENVSFSIDTDWKLGFIGRNGKGKTTFLNLLMGKYDYSGSISTNTQFDYFPYSIDSKTNEQAASDFIDIIKPGVEEWRVIAELSKLNTDPEIMYRPFKTLSFGEQTKILLAVLFSGDNEFLLIDEPTNHLDHATRNTVKKYLAGKKGFILVSHDRDLLDACIDHVLVLNKSSIEVQTGNFSSWWENKEKTDAFNIAENQKHIKEIKKLHESAERASRWATQNEQTKIGFDPLKEPERNISTRAYIGAKTKKMQSRVTSMKKRIYNEIEKKEGLLNDIENEIDLKLMPLKHYKETLISLNKLNLSYSPEKPLITDLSFNLNQGDRIFLKGKNGCGKTSLIKEILKEIDAMNNIPPKGKANEPFPAKQTETEITTGIFRSGLLKTASGIVVSYINQDTSFLSGNLKDYCKKNAFDYSLFLSLLSQLDLSRIQFSKNIEEYSEGQKKKVLIASSLITSAHLYIWDEPLNYIDVFSRIQIENLIIKYKPTMLLVEHDEEFMNKIATKIIDMNH